MKPDVNNTNIGSISHLWMTMAYLFLIVAIFVFQEPLFLLVLLFLTISIWITARTELKIKDVQIAGAALFSAIVLPPLTSLPGLPDIRLEELLFFLIFPLLILKKEPTGNDKLYNSFILTIIAFGSAIVLSTVYGKYILGVPVIIRDYFELLKVFKLLVVVIAIKRFDLKKDDVYKLLYVVIISFLISSLLGLMQFYGILGFERITAPYYFSERIFDVHNRMMGTFSNPNTYGTVLTLGAVVTAVLVFYEKEIWRKILLTILVLVFSFTVALTQSRTAIVVLVLAFFLVFGLNIYKNRFSLKQITFFSAVIFVTVLLFISVLSEDIITRFSALSDISEDTSWQMRMFAWYLNLTIFFDSIVFGWGPAKMIHTTIVDSEYILVLRRYGVFGFTIYLFIYFIPLYRAFLFQAKDGIAGAMGQIILVSVIVFLVGNITNPLFHEIQFIDYWMIILGIFFAMKPDTYNIYKKNE